MLGMLVAVIVCPANSGETVDESLGITMHDRKIPFNRLWGEKDEWLNTLEEFAIKVKIPRATFANIKILAGTVRVGG